MQRAIALHTAEDKEEDCMKRRTAALFLSLLFFMIPPPTAETVYAAETAFYVSPNGSDTASGTKEQPFLTLAKAQEAVRSARQTADGDITVYLRGGTYYLSQPLEFTEADGGQNGHIVHYQSYPGEQAVISGARRIAGWQAPTDDSGIWSCSLDLGDLYALGLDVNGTPAKRAESEMPGRVLRGYFEPGSETLNGFYTQVDQLSSDYQNQSDIQLQLTYMWRTYIYNVDAVTSNPDNEQESIVKISRLIGIETDELAAQIALTANGAVNWGYTVINAREELDTPGEFYYDRQNKKIYYMPREGEDMTSAVTEVSVLEKLLAFCGSYGHTVNNISFSQIQFAHTAWQDMARYGFHSGQTQEFYASKEMLGYDEFVGKFFVPAAVQLNFTDEITFTDNVFRAMGTVAIGLYQGAENTKIIGNRFYDLGDGAVTVGLPNQAYESTAVSGCNLAEGQPVTSNAETYDREQRYFTYYGASAAVDPNPRIGWHAQNCTNEFAWLQVDLGAPYEIDRIELDARKKTSQTPTRRFFEVLASNDPSFAEGSYVKLGAQGDNSDDSFPHEGTWTLSVSDDMPYRYVRVRKTKYKELMWINELRVINESMTFNPKYRLSRHTEVSNNYITRAAQQNLGAPAIHTYFTEDAVISHNYIKDMPYSGICAGWGWVHYLTMTTCRNIQIKNNRIENVMSRMVDGGSIYTLGPQPDSEISGNCILGMKNAVSGIYLDSGSNFFTVKNNVIHDAVFAITGGDGDYEELVRENYIYDNYTTSPNGSRGNLQGESTNGVLAEAELFAEGNYPDDALFIVQNAGLQKAWRHLPQTVPESGLTAKAWQESDNVLHVTHYGSMNDERFLRWHLIYAYERAAETLSLIEANTGEGYLMYPPAATARFQAFLADLNIYIQNKDYLKEGQTTLAPLKTELNLKREEVLEKRDALRSESKRLADSLTLRSAEELCALTETSPPASRLRLLAAELQAAAGDELRSHCLRLQMERLLAESGETAEIKLLNVAKNKPVILADNRSESSYLPENLVDDDLRGSNFWFGYKKDAKASFVLDLQRRYPIEQIRIFDRVNPSMPTRGQFEIWGADRADFSDARLLFELDDNTAFAAEGDYTIELPAKPICRYLKYQAKTSGAAVYIREFQVYARAAVREVGQGSTVYTGTTHTGCGGALAVDGRFDTAYATPAENDRYSTLTVDLGSDTYVDMLEIYARKAATNSSIDGNFKIYGSHTAVTDCTAADESGTVYAQMPTADFEALGYQSLAAMAHPTQSYTLTDGGTYEPYPLYNYQTKENFGCWQTMLDSSEAYRYITHRKTAAEQQAQFSEFRLYQLYPDLYTADFEGNAIRLHFSEAMQTSSLTSDALQVLDEEGNSVMYDGVSVNDFTVSITGAQVSAGKTYTVFVKQTAQNRHNVPLSEDKALKVTTPREGISLYCSEDESGETQQDEPEPGKGYWAQLTYRNYEHTDKIIMLALAEYDESDKLVSIASQTLDVAADAAQRFTAGFKQLNDLTGYQLKTYIWDMKTMRPLR